MSFVAYPFGVDRSERAVRIHPLKSSLSLTLSFNPATSVVNEMSGMLITSSLKS